MAKTPIPPKEASAPPPEPKNATKPDQKVVVSRQVFTDFASI